MDDLIFRQAAIEAVSEACFELRGVFGRCECALNALPSAQQWIPVTERLPEKNGMYLVCENCDHEDGVFRYVSIASYAANLNEVDEYDFPGEENKRPGWFRDDSEYGYYEVGTGRLGYITHWRELPEPPKEEP